MRQNQETGRLKARPERAEVKERPRASRRRMECGEISEGPPCGSGEASEGRTGCEGVEGDKGEVAAVVEDEAGELAMHKEAEDRRCAVDEVPPGGYAVGIDAEEIGTRGDAAGGGSPMEAHGVAFATRHRERSAKTVEAG